MKGLPRMLREALPEIIGGLAVATILAIAGLLYTYLGLWSILFVVAGSLIGAIAVWYLSSRPKKRTSPFTKWIEVQPPVLVPIDSKVLEETGLLPSNIDLLKTIIRKHFAGGTITEHILSSNIKTMSFREEWQFIVNGLVSETKSNLRAMVFDTELVRWWNSLPGQIYMTTNIGLLKKDVEIKRIFILSSVDMRVRTNALLSAYVHHELGANVRLCTLNKLKEELPFDGDMFSVHDDLFVAIYYLTQNRSITNLIFDHKYVADFVSFYDELFKDDRLVQTVEAVLATYGNKEVFYESAKYQIEYLQKLSDSSSTIELIKNSLY